MPEPIEQWKVWYASPDGKARWIRDAESVEGFNARSFLAGYAARASEQASTDTGQLPALPPQPGKQAVVLRRVADLPRPSQTESTVGPGPRRPPGDLFERVRLTGPQQAALDSLYPLPGTSERVTPTVWDGQEPETRPQPTFTPFGQAELGKVRPPLPFRGDTERYPRAE